MIKSLIMSSLILFSASVGVWVKTDGTEMSVPCPSDFDKERLRIPQGCTSYKPGIWLSVDRYRQMEVDLAGMQERLQAKNQEIKLLEATRDRLQGQLLICTAVPQCPSCPNTFFQNTVTGAAIGTVLSLGGCAVWTLSR